MNDIIKRLIKYCDEYNCTILKIDAKDNDNWDMTVVRNHRNNIENIYFDKKNNKWDFE